MRKKNGKRKKRLRNAVIWVLGMLMLMLLWVAYIQWRMCVVAASPPPEHADAGIVLGAALRNGRPSPALRERLDQALKLYREGRFDHWIVSGGRDYPSAKYTEAQGMKLYLLEQGVPDASIIEENDARSTYENLQYSKRIMESRGWSRAVIVTHAYHGARALDIARFVGYSRPAVSTVRSEVLWMPWHRGRETLAFTKWTLDKLTMTWTAGSRSAP